jgi:predicted DsbA family dithiol-disulfide isomerase
MKITIWSDFVCPYCYIGQSHLEKALENFEHAEEVEIEYKSFLLSPEAKYIPGKDYYQTFADLKGMPLEQVKTIFKQVTDMAKNAGVEINYDKAKFASTVEAHRVFQYAKEQGKGNEFFSRFYAAHFTDGEVLSDTETIVHLAEEMGLDGEKVREAILSKEYSDQVTQDITESRQVGVQGVPFYVFDNKYAVSGAQPVQYFEQVLDKVWEEKANQ